jgi:hypothetical protein
VTRSTWLNIGGVVLGIAFGVTPLFTACLAYRGGYRDGYEAGKSVIRFHKVGQQTNTNEETGEIVAKAVFVSEPVK